MESLIIKFNLINNSFMGNSELCQYAAIRLDPDLHIKQLLIDAANLCNKFIDEYEFSEDIKDIDKDINTYVFEKLQFNENFYKFLKNKKSCVKSTIEQVLIDTSSTNEKIITHCHKCIRESNTSLIFESNTVAFIVYNTYLLDQFRPINEISDLESLTKLERNITKYRTMYYDNKYIDIVKTYDFSNLLVLRDANSYWDDNGTYLRKCLSILKMDHIWSIVCDNINNSIKDNINKYLMEMDKLIFLSECLLDFRVPGIATHLTILFDNKDFAHRFYTYVVINDSQINLSKFNQFFSGFKEFINENVALICDNYDNTIKNLSSPQDNEIIIFIDNVIKEYKETVLIVDEFRALTVNIKNKHTKLQKYNKVSDNKSYDLNLVTFKCDATDHIDKENNTNMVLNPALQYYITTFNAFYVKKYEKRTHLIMPSKCTVTVSYNDFTINGKILDINIMMTIVNYPNSTIDTVLQMLKVSDEDIDDICDDIIALQKHGYIKYDQSGFSIPKFNKDIIVDTDIIINTKDEKDLVNVAECYIVKMLKSASTLSFSDDEIHNHIISLNIDSFTKSDTLLAINNLLSKHIVKYQDEKYSYIL